MEKNDQHSKPHEIMMNETEIKELQMEHTRIMSKLSTIKDMTLWDSEHNKALSIQHKISNLRKKNQNLRAGLPENGYSDYHDNYKINN